MKLSPHFTGAKYKLEEEHTNEITKNQEKKLVPISFNFMAPHKKSFVAKINKSFQYSFLVLCFTSLIPGLSSPNQTSPIFVFIKTSIESELFLQTLISIIIGSLPIGLDLCFEYIFSTSLSNFSSSEHCCRGFLLSSLLVSDTIIFLYCNFIGLNLTISLCYLKVSISSLLISNYLFQHELFSKNSSSLLAIPGLCMIATVLFSILGFASNSTSQNIFIFLGNACQLLSLLPILILSYKLWKYLSSRSCRADGGSSYGLCEAVFMFLDFSLIFLSILISPAYGMLSRNMQPQNYIPIYFAIEAALVLACILLTGWNTRGDFCNTKSTSELKRTIVRYISHEVRTPLNIVSLGLSLLASEMLEKGCDPQDIGNVQEILDTNEIAVHILDDLLTYDKLEGGHIKLRVKEEPAKGFLTNVIRPFYVQARHAGVSLSLSIPRASRVSILGCFLQIDKDKMSLVIRNLLSNALKFTAAGGKVVMRVTVTRRKRRRQSANLEAMSIIDDLEELICVQVIDTGVGMSAEQVGKLFGGDVIQFQAGKLHHGQGAGLGLYIAKGIVELHGGTISAYSDGEGCGSSFQVELPCHRNPNSLEGEEEGTGSGAGTGRGIEDDMLSVVSSHKKPSFDSSVKRVFVEGSDEGERLGSLFGSLKNGDRVYGLEDLEPAERSQHSMLAVMDRRSRIIIADNAESVTASQRARSKSDHSNSTQEPRSASILPSAFPLFRSLSQRSDLQLAVHLEEEEDDGNDDDDDCGCDNELLRFLVVDDNRDSQRLWRMLLASRAKSINIIDYRDDAKLLRTMSMVVSNAANYVDVLIISQHLEAKSWIGVVKDIQDMGYSGTIVVVLNDGEGEASNEDTHNDSIKLLQKPVTLDKVMTSLRGVQPQSTMISMLSRRYLRIFAAPYLAVKREPQESSHACHEIDFARSTRDSVSEYAVAEMQEFLDELVQETAAYNNQTLSLQNPGDGVEHKGQHLLKMISANAIERTTTPRYVLTSSSHDMSHTELVYSQRETLKEENVIVRNPSRHRLVKAESKKARKKHLKKNLSQSERIVEHVHIDSKRMDDNTNDGGTPVRRFSVSLEDQMSVRLLDPKSPTAPSPSPSSSTSSLMSLGAPTVSIGGLRILVVDDVPMNRKMMCRMLQNKAVTDEAKDGAVATAMVQKSIEDGAPYVAVLMDYQMPEMDGPTAANRMRAMGFDGPIIGVTGNALPEDIREFLRQGADRVLTKPIKVQEFEAAFEELRKRRPPASPKSPKRL